MSCRRAAIAALTVSVALFAAPAFAQIGPDVALFRVFLNNGRTLASYGEWAQLDDRIVFSMPTQLKRDPVELHLVSIPAAQVDWAKTNAYADAVRGSVYSMSRGEADFARFSDQVAAVLNQVAAL